MCNLDLRERLLQTPVCEIPHSSVETAKSDTLRHVYLTTSKGPHKVGIGGYRGISHGCVSVQYGNPAGLGFKFERNPRVWYRDGEQEPCRFDRHVRFLTEYYLILRIRIILQVATAGERDIVLAYMSVRPAHCIV